MVCEFDPFLPLTFCFDPFLRISRWAAKVIVQVEGKTPHGNSSEGKARQCEKGKIQIYWKRILWFIETRSWPCTVNIQVWVEVTPDEAATAGRQPRVRISTILRNALDSYTKTNCIEKRWEWNELCQHHDGRIASSNCCCPFPTSENFFHPVFLPWINTLYRIPLISAK